MGSPLPAVSLLADLLCLSPPRSLPQEKDAEAGLKIESRPLEDGETSVCLGGLCWDAEAAFGEGEGFRWGLRGHPWVLVSGCPSPHDCGTPPLRQGHQEGMWLQSSR